MPELPDEDDDAWSVETGPLDAGRRLDVVLAAGLPAFSRNRIKALIENGAAAINGEPVRDASRRVRSGDLLTLIAPPPVDAEPEAENIPLSVLYEDESLIVIDKPSGLVVHPAPGNPSGTLVNALLFHCGQSLKGIGGVRRPGIVHRLDKDTSGVMVAAKTELAQAGLAAQFADHGRTGPLHRLYAAFVWGSAQQAKGTVDAPLARDPGNRLRQAVRTDGRPAITHYRVAARYGEPGWDISRLDCTLETGRTHQIRVHVAHIGHPVVGDPVYASGFATKINRLPAAPAAAVAALGRQALHAAELGIVHPLSGEEMRFSAPLPPDLEALHVALIPYDLARGPSAR